MHFAFEMKNLVEAQPTRKITLWSKTDAHGQTSDLDGGWHGKSRNHHILITSASGCIDGDACSRYEELLQFWSVDPFFCPVLPPTLRFPSCSSKLSGNAQLS